MLINVILGSQTNPFDLWREPSGEQTKEESSEPVTVKSIRKEYSVENQL